MIIHKQILDYRQQQVCKIHLPRYGAILSCDFQGEDLVIWYSFQEGQRDELIQERIILMLRTGDSYDGWGRPVFIGTAHDRNTEMPFVIHVFELI